MHLPRLSFIFAAVLLCTRLQAAELELVPYQPGDSWTYQLLRDRQALTFQMMYSIEKMRNCDGDWMYSSRRVVAGQPSPIPAIEGAIKGDICLLEFVFNNALGLEHSCVVKPEIGKRWSVDRSNAKATVVNDYQVIGWENVSVPAGSFLALRINGKLARRPRTENAASAAPGETYLDTRMTYWFVPSVKAFVKTSLIGSDENGKVLFESATELAAYTIAPTKPSPP